MIAPDPAAPKKNARSGAKQSLKDVEQEEDVFVRMICVVPQKACIWIERGKTEQVRLQDVHQRRTEQFPRHPTSAPDMWWLREREAKLTNLDERTLVYDSQCSLMCQC